MEDTIMKKTYINPEMAVVEMKMNNAMLAGSLSKFTTTINDENDVLSREDDWGWDDEDEGF
jgi:hypothetical protein